MNTWKLKKGAESSVWKGHPWVFGKDLDHPEERSPAGSFVRLVDAQNKEVAFGYGNLESAISFRALPLLGHPKLGAMASVGAQSSDFLDWISSHIAKAWQRRSEMGFRHSFRVIFSEGDGLPGLILDRYLLESGEQVLAAQVLTMGMDKIWGDGLRLLEAVIEKAKSAGSLDFAQTFVVERKDVSIRKHEGLEVLPPKILHFPKRFKDSDEAASWLRSAPVLVECLADREKTLTLEADLFEGQKTGFFLDQSLNMSLILQMLERRSGKELRVLDLCSYVGHWSLQLGAFAKAKGLKFESALVDVSGEALKRASENLKRAGLNAKTYEVDVMKEMNKWPEGEFDIVIADPPAFVKAKKDLAIGLKAYQKLNAEAASKVKDGGLLVSCSCSGLVSENEITNLLPLSFLKAKKTGRILCRGNQGIDHPWDPSFPEGRYLKMILSQIFG